MKTAITLRRLAVAALTATTIGVGPVDHIVDAGRSGPEVPERIDVEDGNKVFLVGHAVGVQIYRCNAGATGFGWALVAPRADLYGDNGKLIVTHYGGPTWKAKDGSTVVGSRVDGVTVDDTAIPWLLLKKATTTPGDDGDRLTDTTFIQRVATTGGLAPDAATCNADDRRRRRRDPLHGRLLLLEVDRRLTEPPGGSVIAWWGPRLRRAFAPGELDREGRGPRQRERHADPLTSR